jgi:hypothetical protein
MNRRVLKPILLLFVCGIFIFACCETISSDGQYNIEASSKTSNEYTAIGEFTIVDSNISKEEGDLSYNIKFPQIDGLDDFEKQAKINDLIKNEAISVLNYYLETRSDVEIEINYEITLQTSKLLSIQYYGMGTVSGAAHPNKLFYTTNIDLVDEKKLRLSDIVSIDSKFANKFINGEFTPMWIEQSEKINWNEFIVEELISDFNNADSFEYIGSERQSDIFCYLTEKALGISIPVSPVIGGHAEFEIEFQCIEDNLQIKVYEE